MSVNLLISVLLIAGVVILGVLPPLLRHRQARGRGLLVTALLALVCSGVGGALYLGSDNRDRAQRIALHETNPQAAMRGLAEDMRERLQAEGESADPRNYFLLGRALSAAGEWGEAVVAYVEANKRSEEVDPNLLVAEAEARLNDPERDAAGHDLARKRIDQALAVAPQHPSANFFAGALALGAGNEAEALPHLRVVLASDLLQGAARERLAQRVERIAAQTEGSSGRSEKQNAGSINVTVRPGTERDLRGGTLFVFVRRPDGPPMPLAARRIDAPQWPVTVALTDDDRLAGGPSLFGHEALEIAARWSAEGDALSDRDGPQASQRIDPANQTELELQLRAQPPD